MENSPIKYSNPKIVVFILVVVAVTFVSGIGSSVYLSNAIYNAMESKDLELIPRVVVNESDSHISIDTIDHWQEPAAQEAFSQFFEQFKPLSHVIGIKVYNTGSVLIASNISIADVGSVHEQEDVAEAIAEGNFWSEVEPNAIPDVQASRILELFAPIYLDQNEAAAVIELYLDDSKNITAIRQMQYAVWVPTFGAAVFFFLILFYIFRRLTDTISKQAKDLSVIYEKSPIGIFTINKNGVIDSVNPAMNQLEIGLGDGSIIGTHVLENSVFKKLGLGTKFKLALEGKSFTTIVEIALRRNKYYKYQAVPIAINGSKEITRVLAMVSDITKQKELEIELDGYSRDLEKKVQDKIKEVKESEGKFRMLTDTSPDCIKQLDLNGNLLYMSPGGLKEHGLKTPEEAVGFDYLGTIVKGYRTTVLKALKDAKQGTSSTFEVQHIPKTADRDWCKMTLAPIKNESGKITAVYGVSRDISEQKEREAHIKELNELRKKFIHIVAHQLRTPLNSIRWNLEALLGEDLGKVPDNQKEFIQVTHAADVEVIRRIDDLITAIDIEEGKVSLEKDSISIESLWGPVLTKLKNGCKVKDLVCDYTSSTEFLKSLSLDTEKLRVALGHIIENAVNYTEEKGKISVSIKPSGKKLRIEVIDTGIGIPEHEQKLVFTRFFRASNASSMKADASGLGLFIAKCYIEEHGGSIGFTSTEGKGSMFWVELPIT